PSRSGTPNQSPTLQPARTVPSPARCTLPLNLTGSRRPPASVLSPYTTLFRSPGNNSATDTDALAAQANLGITKTDGVTIATPGGSVTYTITASNAGPSHVTAATITDTFPSSLTCNWTCVGASGGTCTASRTGN